MTLRSIHVVTTSNIPSFLWLNIFPLYVCVSVCMYIYISFFLYPFMYPWAFTVYPCLGYCEQCYSEVGVQTAIQDGDLMYWIEFRLLRWKLWLSLSHFCTSISGRWRRAQQEPGSVNKAAIRWNSSSRHFDARVWCHGHAGLRVTTGLRICQSLLSALP